MAKFRDLYLPAEAIGQNISLLFSAGILLLPTVSQVFVVAEVAHRLLVTNAPTAAEVVEPFPRQPKVRDPPPSRQTCVLLLTIFYLS